MCRFSIPGNPQDYVPFCELNDEKHDDRICRAATGFLTIPQLVKHLNDQFKVIRPGSTLNQGQVLFMETEA